MNPILLQENYRFFNLIIFTNKNYFVSINLLKNTSKFDINNLIAFTGDNQWKIYDFIKKNLPSFKEWT